MDGKQRFIDLSNGIIRSGGFDLNGLWSPWYVQHKLFAGLRDAYRYADNSDALQIETKFAEWVEKILSKLNDDQLQSMLGTEFGGMNEVLAELYADTADQRWLVLADKFHQKAIIDPLSKDRDVIAHTHGNTQVPKLYGELIRYVYTGNQADENSAKFFWDRVVNHYTFATGGHGKNEYFGQPDKLNDMVDGRTAETCNVYNMLKMTRTLFSVEPDIRYADFHERALFNHILASQDPRDGTVTYMLPVGRGVQHEYQRMFDDFTCCVGTSMESHALHGAGIYYYKGSEELWIGLYAPSVARWDSAGVEVVTATDFPIGPSASVKIRTKAPKKFMLAIRRPYWAGDGFTVKVNGQAFKNISPADSYIKINRVWLEGDTVDLNLPKQLRKEPLPDNPSRMAFMWGPLVLAGDLGPETRTGEENEENPPAPSAPPLVISDQPLQRWLRPESATGVVQDNGSWACPRHRIRAVLRTSSANLRGLLGRLHSRRMEPTFYRIQSRPRKRAEATGSNDCVASPAKCSPSVTSMSRGTTLHQFSGTADMDAQARAGSLLICRSRARVALICE